MPLGLFFMEASNSKLKLKQKMQNPKSSNVCWLNLGVYFGKTSFYQELKFDMLCVFCGLNCFAHV